MFSNKKFGLPDDLIEAARKIGNQSKAPVSIKAERKSVKPEASGLLDKRVSSTVSTTNEPATASHQASVQQYVDNHVDLHHPVQKAEHKHNVPDQKPAPAPAVRQAASTKGTFDVKATVSDFLKKRAAKAKGPEPKASMTAARAIVGKSSEHKTMGVGHDDALYQKWKDSKSGNDTPKVEAKPKADVAAKPETRTAEWKANTSAPKAPNTAPKVEVKASKKVTVPARTASDTPAAKPATTAGKITLQKTEYTVPASNPTKNVKMDPVSANPAPERGKKITAAKQKPAAPSAAELAAAPKQEVPAGKKSGKKAPAKVEGGSTKKTPNITSSKTEKQKAVSGKSSRTDKSGHVVQTQEPMNFGGPKSTTRGSMKTDPSSVKYKGIHLDRKEVFPDAPKASRTKEVTDHEKEHKDQYSMFGTEKETQKSMTTDIRTSGPKKAKMFVKQQAMPAHVQDQNREHDKQAPITRKGDSVFKSQTAHLDPVNKAKMEKSYSRVKKDVKEDVSLSDTELEFIKSIMEKE